MLPGAPRVTYTSSEIEYDYGPQSIHLIFSKIGDPRIVYRQNTQSCEKAKELAGKITTGAKNLVQRTDLPLAWDRSKELTKNVVTNGVDRTNDFVRSSIIPIQNAIRSLPGVAALTADPEDRAKRARDTQIRRATEKMEGLNLSIPTNR